MWISETFGCSNRVDILEQNQGPDCENLKKEIISQNFDSLDIAGVSKSL